jgi:hypothetical protein
MVLCLALLLAGFIAIGSPHAAAAAPDNTTLYSLQDDAGAAVPPDQPIVSVPGVVSLWLGQGFSMQDDGIRLENAQVDLPALNATATVNGLSVSLRDQSYSWDSITLSQAAPVGNQVVTVSDLEATVGGKASNYSADVSTRIDVQPNEQVQVGATLGVSYDGLTGQASFSLADGAASVAVGPATATVDGMSVADGALSLDTAQVLFPEAGIGVRIEGYTLANGQSDWTALTWYGQEFKLGDVVTLSDTLVVAPGPSSAAMTPVGATTHVSIEGGDVASMEGQLVFTYDRATGQPSFALRDASAVFGVPEWNVALTGVDAGKAGVQVDTIAMTAAPVGIQAQVNGLAMSSASGVTFDQASFLYRPAPADGGQSIAGFQLVVDSTEAGYIVSTTTLVPTNKSQ